jgi:hypothetical protein
MFTTRFTKSIAGVVLAAGTLGLTAIVGAGAANASSLDDAFVATLAQADIPQIQPALEISAGHAVCQNLESPRRVRTLHFVLKGDGEGHVYTSVEQLPARAA